MLQLTRFHQKYRLQIALMSPYCNHHQHPLHIFWSVCIIEEIFKACFNAAPTILHCLKSLAVFSFKNRTYWNNYHTM
jgi:hypothetical protein